MSLRLEGAAPQPEGPRTCPGCGMVYYGPMNQTHEILCPLRQKGLIDKWGRPLPLKSRPCAHP
jgi:hypothetical protein